MDLCIYILLHFKDKINIDFFIGIFYNISNNILRVIFLKTRFIVVRHGEADGNIQRIFHGHFNSSLTETGHLQARKTADLLKNYKIDHIYSSDLDRTVQTAEHIAKHRNILVVKDSRLREIFGGKWENVAWSDLPEKFSESYSLWEDDIGKVVMPEGESVAQLFDRLKDALSEIAKCHIGETVCIVTHGTAIRSLLCLWRDIPLDDMQKTPWFDNASVTVVDYLENGQYSLLAEGYNNHLADCSTFAKQDWWQRYK